MNITRSDGEAVDNRVTDTHDVASIYRSTGPRLMRFATALVGSNDAEDVVSRAVEKTLRSRGFERADNPQAYLHRAVYTAALSWRKRKALSKRLVPRMDRPADDIATPQPEVRRAVDQLSVQQRACVVLTYWGDLERSSVAEYLGITEGSVAQHLARARAHLKESLHE